MSGAAEGGDTTLRFVPEEIIGATLRPLVRPAFLAIVASDVLAKTLQRKST